MQPQMMQPFVTKFTEPDRIIQFHQDQIMQTLAIVNTNVTNTSDYVAHQLQTMEQRVKNAEKKRRKRSVSESLAVQSDGKIVCIQKYDDETQDVKEFAYNLHGNWSVARVKFTKINFKEAKYVIIFSQANIWIIGNVNKNNGKNLYEAFVKAGVIFAQDNSVSKIERILFTAFGTAIDRTQAVYSFPELAGWNEGRFLYAEKCNYEKRMDFPCLPVMKKHFTFQRGNKEQLVAYLKIYRNITSWQERLLILEMPVLGILSSIFVEEERNLNRFLNLVFCENIPTKALLSMLQIFNRSDLRSIDAGMNSNSLRKILEEANDEVIIVDATGVENGYMKKKKQDNVRQIVKKICHSGNSAFAISRDLNLVLIVINDTLLVQPEAINLILSDELLRLQESVKNMERQTVDIFLTEFVSFAESRLEEIRTIIRNSGISTESILQTAWEILELFCCTYGINIYTAGTFPPHINFEKLLEKFTVPEDLSETFVTSIRKEISHWYVMEKHRMQKYVFSACYYDEKFFWIPTKILDRMLVQEGMLPYKLNVLYEMKKNGNLLTDSTGLSSRLQIGGRRIEAYKFLRTCFSMAGGVDIIDLGKEIRDRVDG